MYREKYFKYKNKYLTLQTKFQMGGILPGDIINVLNQPLVDRPTFGEYDTDQFEYDLEQYYEKHNAYYQYALNNVPKFPDTFQYVNKKLEQRLYTDLAKQILINAPHIINYIEKDRRSIICDALIKEQIIKKTLFENLQLLPLLDYIDNIDTLKNTLKYNLDYFKYIKRDDIKKKLERFIERFILLNNISNQKPVDKSDLNDYTTDTEIMLAAINYDLKSDLISDLISDLSSDASANIKRDKKFIKLSDKLKIKRDGLLLKNYPDLQKDEDAIKYAITSNGLALEFVDRGFMTYQHVLDAYNKNNNSLIFATNKLLLLLFKEGKIDLNNASENGIQFIVEQDKSAFDLLNDINKKKPKIIEKYLINLVSRNGLLLEDLKNLSLSTNIDSLSLKDTDLNKHKAFLVSGGDNTQNIKIVNAAFKQNIKALEYAHETLLSDYSFIINASNQNIEALTYASDKLKIKDGAYTDEYSDIVIKHLDLIIKSDILLKILKRNFINETFMLKVFEKYKSKKYPKEIQEFIFNSEENTRLTRKFILENVSLYPILQYVSVELKDDDAVVLAAVTTDGLMLEHASTRLKDDRKVVLAAVSNNGLTLEHASTKFKSDKEIVLAAVKNNKNAIKHALGNFKRYKDDYIKILNKERPKESLIDYITRRSTSVFG
jgi:hypothetical protein